MMRGTGPVLKKGMTLAIEPMVNIGGWETKSRKQRLDSTNERW